MTDKTMIRGLKTKCECKKCGYTWESKKDNPKACPKCKSYRWGKKNDEQNAGS